MNKQNIRPVRRVLAVILSLALLLTFTPLSGMVTLSAGALDDSVTYIGADGTLQTITDYNTVNSSTTIRHWRTGNYVVRDNVIINVSGNAAVKFSGTVNLILCNGAHLTVNSTGGSAFTGRDNELNIFAQSTGSNKGKLTARGDEGIRCGSLNVYGGEVTFEGTSYGLHLDGNNDSDGLTVNGGDVNNDSDGLTVNGGDVRIVNHTDDQAVIYDESSIGHVTVDGGTLTVSSSGGGKAIEYTNSIAFNDGTANITGNITDFSTLALNGGNITIKGGLGGFNEDASKNEVILDYQRPTDKYKITNLNKLSDENDYTVKVAENKTVSADGTSYTGTLTAEQREAISGKDITPFFGTVTVADGIANGTVTASKTNNLIYGDTVTLTVTPKTGYVVESVTAGSVQVTKVDDTHYTFTMPASDVTVSATFTPDSARFSQDGDTYTIHDAAGWDVFCDCLQDNDTYNRFSGKTVELGDNITVSRMAGSSKHDFCGTFEGKNKVLTFTSTESVNGTAPFSYVSETTPTGGTAVSHPVIRNLNVVCDITTSETHASGLVGRMWGELTIANCTVSGTITSSNKYACGFIGEQNGTANIKNCRSSVEINSSVNGDGTHGGLVAVNNKNAKLTIEGCVFDGKIVSTGDDDTTSCGGFVGWRDKNGSLTITNSLYAPTADDNAVADGATFARNWTMPDNTNSYYTRALGAAQGKQAYTITAGDDVTLGLSGNATEYNVSGINVYSSGIEYNGNLYAGSGDTVALELEYTGTPEAGYIQNGYTASAGTLSGTTLTMPAEDVTINAYFDVESTFDAGTGTLTLKGTILNDDGIVLPDGVNMDDVLEIVVDSSGATLPQDSSYLFSYFDNVTSIDLTGADTSGVKNMYGMFFQCLNLRKLDLSSFDTSRVNDMSNMFYYCKKLATLDLSGFDTKNVYGMVSMFESCTGLTTIYVSNEWSTVSANFHSLMFTWCYNLTGGNGTAFDPEYIDKTYAVIDKDGQPGYLTGLFALKLPDNMEIVTDADENMKVGSKYLSGAALTVKPKTGYTASNVKANGTDLTADDNGVYTVTITDSNVTVTADFAFSDGIGAALAGHSISLEGDIGVNYYTELSDAIAKSETAKMHFTIPTGAGTKTQDVSVKDAKVDTVGGKTYYIFKCQVAAKEMTSQITAQLIDGEYKSDVFPYSVKEYADWLLAHTGDNADYAKAAPLVKAMLNYGAYAQLYFDKNTGTLANAGLSAEEKELGDVAITIVDPVINLPDGVTFEGATLSLKSETTLSLYFTSSDALTFSCEGYDVVPDSKGGYKIARIRGIKAADIGKTLTLNVSGGTVSYSPLNYCKYVLADNTQNEKLQNAVKALYLYWQDAAAYFGAPAPDPAAGIFFTKVTDESEITRGNIGVCTFEEAKAWAIANWDNITDTVKADVYIVFSDDNRICYIRIEIWVTAIQDIEEMSEPDIGMDINVIKYYYTYNEEDNEEDFYLCGRSFKKVTDESRITLENIGECTFEEAKAWVIANWVDIMGTDSTPVNIVFFNGNDICLIQISETTDITDFMEIDVPDIGMRIDFIQDLFTEFCGDVYLCSPAALP